MTPKAMARQLVANLKNLTPGQVDTMAERDPAMAALLKRVMNG